MRLLLIIIFLVVAVALTLAVECTLGGVTVALPRKEDCDAVERIYGSVAGLCDRKYPDYSSCPCVASADCASLAFERWLSIRWMATALAWQ